MSMRGRWARWAAIGIGSMMAAAGTASPASADHSLMELVSTGPAGDVGGPAGFVGASPDGTHVFFETTGKLVNADTDAASDVYERSGGQTTLVSTGPTGGNDDSSAVDFKGVSAGGTRVPGPGHRGPRRPAHRLRARATGVSRSSRDALERHARVLVKLHPGCRPRARPALVLGLDRAPADVAHRATPGERNRLADGCRESCLRITGSDRAGHDSEITSGTARYCGLRHTVSDLGPSAPC